MFFSGYKKVQQKTRNLVSFWLKRSNAVAAMSAVLKQLQASQSFLTQVRRLQNYNQLQQRQFVVLKSLVGKTLSVTAAEATRIYDAMDREIWTEEPVSGVAELRGSSASRGQSGQEAAGLLDFSKLFDANAVDGAGGLRNHGPGGRESLEAPGEARLALRSFRAHSGQCFHLLAT